MNFKKQVFLIFFTLLCLCPLYVTAQTSQTDSNDPTVFSTAQLVSPLKAISKQTKNIPVGIKITLNKGWHSYWKYPGESGKPLTVKWVLPENMVASTLKWPAPSRWVTRSVPHDIINFVYHNLFLLISRLSWTNLHLHSDFKNLSDSISVFAQVEWLICKAVCIPLSQKLSLTFPIKDQEEKHPQYPALFNDWMKKIPILKPQVTTIKLVQDDWLISLSSNISSRLVDFLPLSPHTFAPIAPQVINTNDTQHSLLVKKARNLQSEKDIQAVGVFENIVKEQPIKTAYLFHFKKEKSFIILWFLFLAFLGGFLLNFMPCVLPIVFLKFSSAVSAPRTGFAAIFCHIAYSIGIIVTFLILAGIITILKMGGEFIGWGFQMQSPHFLLTLILLFTLLSFNFIGWFNAALPAAHFLHAGHSYFKHFLTGVLSVSAASPCTVPFMGAAVGYALSGQIWEIWLVFSFLGLGLASPYLFLSIFPKFFSYLPPPGAWSEKLKKFMAFPMLASSAWLISLLNKLQSNILLPVLMSLVFLSMGFWLISHTQKMKWVLRIIIIASLFYPFFMLQASDQHRTIALKWESFSVQRMQEKQQTGQPVLLNFSAAWCLTCYFNEWMTFQNAQVIQHIHQQQIQLLKGDWTDKNEEITRVLNQYGRSGIPFYLYLPVGKEPVLLPELLTPSIFIEYTSPQK